jgi:hypothetical protein
MIGVLYWTPLELAPTERQLYSKRNYVVLVIFQARAIAPA